MDSVKKYLWQIVAIVLLGALVVTGGALWMEQAAHAETRATRDAVQIAYTTHLGGDARASVKELEDKQTREAFLQDAADQERKAKDDQINRIAAQLDAARRELRNRPSRPASEGKAGAAASAPTGDQVQGCTGAELYADDGLFLIGEAARAEQLRLDYNELWSAYERARTVGSD